MVFSRVTGEETRIRGVSQSELSLELPVKCFDSVRNSAIPLEQTNLARNTILAARHRRGKFQGAVNEAATVGTDHSTNGSGMQFGIQGFGQV
jgi:hypothetical protein